MLYRAAQGQGLRGSGGKAWHPGFSMPAPGRVPAPHSPQNARTPVPLFSTGAKYRQVPSTAGPENSRYYRSPSPSVPGPDPVRPRSLIPALGIQRLPTTLSTAGVLASQSFFPESLEAVPELPHPALPTGLPQPCQKSGCPALCTPLGSHLSPPGSLRSSPDPQCPLPEAAPGAGLHR